MLGLLSLSCRLNFGIVRRIRIAGPGSLFIFCNFRVGHPAFACFWIGCRLLSPIGLAFTQLLTFHCLALSSIAAAPSLFAPVSPFLRLKSKISRGNVLDPAGFDYP